MRRSAIAAVLAGLVGAAGFAGEARAGATIGLGLVGLALARRRRTVAVASCLFLLATPLPSRAADETALKLCRKAFPNPRAAEWLALPLVPLAWLFGPEKVFEGLWRVGLLRGWERGDLERKLEPLHQAADLGHLPSRFLLASWFVGTKATDYDPPLTTLLSEEERWATYEKLAEATFAQAELAIAGRNSGEGFHPKGRFKKGFDEHAAALKRWHFFVWATRAGLHGERMAWEELARNYARQNDEFESSAEDRERGYAWAHLRNLPVYDWERDPRMGTWQEEKRAAWGRLRGASEQARAEALARRYEREIFPRLLRDENAWDLCAIEPQFADARIAARLIPDPVGPPPSPPAPREEPPEPPKAPPGPPPPMPKAPDGITVVSLRTRPTRDVEPPEPIRLAEIPAGQAGVIERVICAVRDAPIFAEKGGFLSLEVMLETRAGPVPLCGFLPRAAWMGDRSLGRRSIPLQGGEVVTMSCRSFRDAEGQRPATRVYGAGCSVDVDLWIAGGRPEPL